MITRELIDTEIKRLEKNERMVKYYQVIENAKKYLNNISFKLEDKLDVIKHYRLLKS